MLSGNVFKNGSPKTNFLKTILKNNFLIVLRNKILFRNSNMKNSFFGLFSIRVMYTYIQCKNSQKTLQKKMIFKKGSYLVLP